MFKLFKKSDEGSAPIAIVAMVIGIVVALYIGMVLLQTLFATGLVTNSSDFWITNLSTTWVAIGGLVLVIPVAVVGWYVLKLITGGGGA